MKQELTTQEDWLVEHNIAVQEPNRELCLTLPLFKEQEPRVDLSCNAITRQRLQQQIEPESVERKLEQEELEPQQEPQHPAQQQPAQPASAPE